MGLLYEKERRAVSEKSMPDVKEVDSLRRSTTIASIHDDDGEWDDLDLVEEDIFDEELDAEEIDDEVI